MKLEDTTVKKIKALILEQKELDDKALYEESQKEETLTIGERLSRPPQ